MLHTLHVRRTLRPDVAVSGQNAWHGGCGAFTGEVAAEQLHDAGCAWVLLGHSERRTFSHESNSYVADKVRHAQDAGLSVLACVGETLAQRQAGEALATVDEQMRAVAEHIKCVRMCARVSLPPHADDLFHLQVLRPLPGGGLRAGVGHRDGADGDAG